MSRATYFLKRTLQMGVVFVLILTFLFFLFRLLPGDATALMVKEGADPETIAAFRERWRLDEPMHVQFYYYVTNLLSGDAGSSIRYQVPVWEFVKFRMLNSAILIAPAVTAGFLIGSVSGTIYGWGSSFVERVGITFAIFVGTIPLFFWSILAILTFGSWLDWVPTAGMTSPTLTRESWWGIYLTWDFARHYVLPFSVIAIAYSGLPTLLMTTSVKEIIEQGFSEYYRITGMPDRVKMMRYARHASLPVITFYPLALTRAIGGLVLVEMVFNWPGMGFALVRAVLLRDYPVAQFVFLLIAAFILVSNFVVDIVYGIIDPRVSVGSDSS